MRTNIKNTNFVTMVLNSRSEVQELVQFLLENGMIDLIIERSNFKQNLTILLKHLMKKN